VAYAKHATSTNPYTKDFTPLPRRKRALTPLSLFVPLYEERDMERRFGEEYREYCRRVPRWLPRLRCAL